MCDTEPETNSNNWVVLDGQPEKEKEVTTLLTPITESDEDSGDSIEEKPLVRKASSTNANTNTNMRPRTIMCLVRPARHKVLNIQWLTTFYTYVIVLLLILISLTLFYGILLELSLKNEVALAVPLKNPVESVKQPITTETVETKLESDVNANITLQSSPPKSLPEESTTEDTWEATKSLMSSATLQGLLCLLFAYMSFFIIVNDIKKNIKRNDNNEEVKEESTEIVHENLSIPNVGTVEEKIQNFERIVISNNNNNNNSNNNNKSEAPSTERIIRSPIIDERLDNMFNAYMTRMKTLHQRFLCQVNNAFKHDADTTVKTHVNKRLCNLRNKYLGELKKIKKMSKSCIIPQQEAGLYEVPLGSLFT